MLFTQSDPFALPFIPDCAGKTAMWYRGDNENRYDQNVSDGHALPYNKTDIIYDWNSMGYRCPEFKPKSDAMRVCLYGDSSMEGYGLSIQDSPAAQFTKQWNSHIDESPEIYNLAKASASNDFISHLVYSTVPVLKPDLVIIYWTYVSRREVYTEDGDSVSFLRNWPRMTIPVPEKYHKIFEAQEALSNWRSDTNNFLRNYMLVKYFLQAHNIPYIWSSVNDNWSDKNKRQYFDDFDRDHYVNCGLEHYGVDLARDLMHPGPKTIDTITERLFSHYCKKFR